MTGIAYSASQCTCLFVHGTNDDLRLPDSPTLKRLMPFTSPLLLQLVMPVKLCSAHVDEITTCTLCPFFIIIIDVDLIVWCAALGSIPLSLYGLSQLKLLNIAGNKLNGLYDHDE